MAQPPSVGTLSKYVCDTVNPPARAFEYVGNFGIGKHNTLLSTDGIRGTRQHPVERTRANLYTVGGPVVMQPGPTDLNFFLSAIMGQTPTGAGSSGSPYNWTPSEKINTYGAGNSVASLYFGIDRIAQQHRFDGCQIAKAVFRGQQGGFMEMELQVEGLTESAGGAVLGGGFAALVPSLQTPYVFSDATLSYGGTSYQFRHFELTVDNVLKLDRFMNSISRTDLPSLDLIISVMLDLPYTSDTTGLYDQNVTQGNVQITLATASNQLQFQLPATQFPTEPPVTPGREEIILPLRGVARRTGTTPPLTVTNY